MTEVRTYVGKQYGRVYAWDKVNSPMIRQWCELMGVNVQTNADGKVVAPPAMLQVWCMEGPVQNNYPPGSTTENPYEVLKLIESHGCSSTVAVNSELTFDRDVVEGEDLYYTSILVQMDMLARAIEKVGSTDNIVPIARALEGMEYDSPFGKIKMRKNDHQASHPLYITQLVKGVKNDAEGMGMGWKTVAKVPGEATELPVACDMKRPS